MDRIQAMQVFTRIVELSSFTRAADSLQLPRATVTYTIKQLEAHLGARLLHRTTRQVRATLDGDAYYHRCVRLLADLEEAEAAFSQVAANPKGKLRVDLQGSLGTLVVIPALPAFCQRYPEIELELGIGDRLVDLVGEGIDCVLRGGELRDSTMVARRVAEFPQVTCASAAYLAQHGIPQSLDDLDRHIAVNYFLAATGRTVDLEFQVDGGKYVKSMKSVVAVNNADAYAACCVAGFGLIQLPRYHVAAQLAEGSLCEVLAQWRPAPMPISVLYPHHRQLSPRVRVFVDWLASLFEGMPV